MHLWFQQIDWTTEKLRIDFVYLGQRKLVPATALGLLARCRGPGPGGPGGLAGELSTAYCSRESMRSWELDAIEFTLKLITKTKPIAFESLLALVNFHELRLTIGYITLPAIVFALEASSFYSFYLTDTIGWIINNMPTIRDSQHVFHDSIGISKAY